MKAVTGDLDHYPLLAETPLDNISLVPQGPELPQPDREARIKWPATAKQLQDYKMQTEMRVGQAARTEAAAMKAAIRRADEIIGNKSHEEKLRLNKRDELKTAGITQEVVLAHASLNTYRTKLKQALHTYRDRLSQNADSWHETVLGSVTSLRASTSTEYRHRFPEAPANPCDEIWEVWAKACSTEMSMAKLEQKTARKAHEQKSIANQIQKMQSGYMRNQKKTHILGKGSNHSLGAVRDCDTKELHTVPDKVTETVRQFYQRLADPATPAGKTGALLPDEAPRQWKHGPMKNRDAFDIETDVGKTDIEQVYIEDHIKDMAVLQIVIAHLSNNKMPGPDEIPNELLKHLPLSMHDAIHQLFILMWMTGTTPDGWKESETILLHKKNDESLLENYRPIALANTMYKLWTGMIQECMNVYADHNNILSNSQEGFRRYRNTMRQLHTLVNVLSDAKLSEQNLYMLYIAFSSAFDTIDHDKLLQIMYDLGFPTDAINVIGDLYTNATTKVKLPMGKT